MQRKYLLLFLSVPLVLLLVGIFPVFAKAPSTAKIVFGANRGQDRDIYLMNPDGTQQVNITNHRADDISPVFSQTGEHILFASDRGNPAPRTWDLYLMDIDGGNVQKVFAKPAIRTSPTWSPDGKQIAYQRTDPGGPFIYIATMEEKKEERVAIGAGPAWSPNGTEIAFVSGTPERKQITAYLINTSSTCVCRRDEEILSSWQHDIPNAPPNDGNPLTKRKNVPP